jgi:predicted enzyme related to lactoylglutathione lyase
VTGAQETITWWAVTIDSHDPALLAKFWSAILGSPIIEPGPDRQGWFRLQPFAPGGPFINFQPVSEMKSGMARLHLDVLVADLDAAVARVIGLGGSDSGAREMLPRGRIAVMRDPDGNEFCLLAAPAM